MATPVTVHQVSPDQDVNQISTSVPAVHVRMVEHVRRIALIVTPAFVLIVVIIISLVVILLLCLGCKMRHRHGARMDRSSTGSKYQLLKNKD
ncbi:hypothetical protein HOLleu_42275 [Holothuria leucospilota]|uniref:Uncharacterized protein n=1 Tax=Holothuria leucospilota TaxID=206669 RepID=A0A9Q1BBE8_HOLLE|nr:hypothetical protein HOLleu_42275 [Holothuria leucospilota]